MGPFQAPILARQQLLQLANDWRENKEALVFTNGCFDLLHVGHLKTLTQARAQGDRLIVGLNSDNSVRQLKGPDRPINTEIERAQLLAALRCVDAVTIFDEQTPVELLKVLRPEVHVKGGDYRREDLPEASVVDSYGGRIVIIGLVPDRSTTALLERAHEA